MSDFTVTNHGSICLLRPNNLGADAWAVERLPADAQRFGQSVAVEHRYIADIVAGIESDGFTVETV